jgi:hypothetical protein
MTELDLIVTFFCAKAFLYLGVAFAAVAGIFSLTRKKSDLAP